jgi:hypothetical protein
MCAALIVLKGSPLLQILALGGSSLQ